MSRHLVRFGIRISRRPIGVAVVYENFAIRILVGFVLFELEVWS